LRQFFSSAGLDFDTTALPDMVDGMIRFYTTVPGQGLAAEDSADMLLFQFGTWNWGKGEFFEFDITRQFIEAGKEDDDAISQLRCVFSYAPTPELSALGDAYRWCESRSDIAALRSFIVSTEAYRTALRLVPVSRTIDWWYV
jgi:hypothetical protein